jgi:putative ABC transport system substrate-binding protein
MMERREFIAGLGGAAAWPLAAHAQPGERLRRVTVLGSLAESDPEGQARVAALARDGDPKLDAHGRLAFSR